METYTDFRVIYSTTWDPRGEYVMSVHVEPAMTLDAAVREAAKGTTGSAGKKRWILCDEARLIRVDDVAGLQVVPVVEPEQSDAPSHPPFGFTVPGQ